MVDRAILSRIQAGLFVLCCVTYAISLVYFWAVLPDTIHTQVNRQGEPTFYMGKSLFLVVYSLLLVPVFLMQYFDRLQAVPAPKMLSNLCRSLNDQTSRLGVFNNPQLWKWIALAAYAFLLFVFLAICASNYNRTA